jgi:hypothetical protein
MALLLILVALFGFVFAGFGVGSSGSGSGSGSSSSTTSVAPPVLKCSTHLGVKPSVQEQRRCGPPPVDP